MLLNDYLFIFLNNTKYIKNTDTKKYCENLLQYWIKETQTQAKVKVFTYIESALEFVKEWSNHKHVVIIDIGNDLQTKNKQFINQLLDSIQPDDVLIGHILDKKDNYYELHNQCFYFNAHVWKSLGCPDYGHYCKEKTLIEPIRSNENHHDDYTPLWVAPGNTERHYKNLRQGYNFVNAFLTAGYKIKSFDQSVRQSKIYAYPFDDQDKISNILDLNLNIMKHYYVFNTEKIKFENLRQQPLDNFATVSAGLNHLKIIKYCGYNSNFKLMFFDYNQSALDIMQKIYTEWDGINYLDFIKNNTPYGYGKSESDNHKNFINFWGDEEKFANWFCEFKKTATVNFLHINILTDNIDCLVDFFDGKNELFWLSNIFHYKPTSITHDIVYRAKKQDCIVDKLKKDLLVYADSCTLNQSKFFTKSSYKKQYPEALSFNEESLK